jgi:hypothetical protein
MLENVNWSGRRVRRMADPTAPKRMMVCGGEEVAVVEWERGNSVTDLLGSTF